MDPGSWARTQNNLGNTLFSLGSLAGDPKRLEEAIAAFLNVLKVLTHEDMPADLASTQNSLGITLISEGSRSSYAHDPSSNDPFDPAFFLCCEVSENLAQMRS